MFGFNPKLPITEEDRRWIDDSFQLLERKVGRRRLLEAQVILPDTDFFPDDYDQSNQAARWMFERVCDYMKVPASEVCFEVFPDEAGELRESMPYWRGASEGAAGFYCRHGLPAAASEDSEKPLVMVKQSQLRDPMALVAVIAHELGHVILLGKNLIDSKDLNHEPLTDLLTVYLGLGIFSANSCVVFKQFQDDRKQGWSVQRLGYLPEEMYGFALAKFALERGEEKPAWIRHLSTNVRSYCRRSMAWLSKNRQHVALVKPIG